MSNLNSAQFDDAYDIEAQQRRRFKRKHESGFVGNGFFYANYPYMIDAMGTGGKEETAQHEKGEGNLSENMGETAHDHVNQAMGSATNGVVDTAMPAPTSDGSGMGGTATGITGGLG